MALLLTWLGIAAVISSLIPVVAILPILLYIGMLIGSQAFQESPIRHAPAINLAMMPQIAAGGKTMIDGARGAAGANAATVDPDKLGGGATLAGIILGAVRCARGLVRSFSPLRRTGIGARLGLSA